MGAEGERVCPPPPVGSPHPNPPPTDPPPNFQLEYKSTSTRLLASKTRTAPSLCSVYMRCLRSFAVTGSKARAAVPFRSRLYDTSPRLVFRRFDCCAFLIWSAFKPATYACSFLWFSWFPWLARMLPNLCSQIYFRRRVRNGRRGLGDRESGG